MIILRVRLPSPPPPGHLKKYLLLNLAFAEVQTGKICNRFLEGDKLTHFSPMSYFYTP